MKRTVQCVSGVAILVAAVLIGLSISSSPDHRSRASSPHLAEVRTAHLKAITKVADPTHDSGQTLPTIAPTTTSTTTGTTSPGKAIPASEYVSSSTPLPDGVTMTPPTNSSPLPEISQQTAVADAIKQGFYWVSVSSTGATAYYGIMTNTAMCSVPAPVGESVAAGNLDPSTLGAEYSAGECTLLYQNVPTWVVEYKGPAEQASGGPSPVGFPANGTAPSPGVVPATTTTVAPPTTTVAAPTTETIYIFINADTGQYMFG
jgi:hypothetical protein